MIHFWNWYGIVWHETARHCSTVADGQCGVDIDIHIGDTLCGGDNPEAIPFQKISEPTLSMNFLVNDSPLAGQEGKFITSRHLRDRLYRELNTDVSLRVEDTETTECFKVSGRGELHLSVQEGTASGIQTGK